METLPLTKIDIAWAAGFFDGEGCILPNARAAGRICLRVTLKQVNKVPLLWLKERFGGHIETIQPKNPNHQVIHRWVLQFKKARTFLAIIHPYLQVKSEHPYFANGVPSP